MEFQNGNPGYYELGLVQREMKHLKEAYEAFCQALQAAQALPAQDRARSIRDIHLNLAEISYAMGDIPRSAAAYKEALRFTSSDDPIRSECLLWLAHCEIKMGKVSEASEHLNELLNMLNGPDSDRQQARTMLPDIRTSQV